MKILWISVYNLLDTTSGGSKSVLEMLTQLSLIGFDIKILSATVFDSPKVLDTLPFFKDFMNNESGKFINIQNDNLDHITLITKSTDRREMTSDEEWKFFIQYKQTVEEFNPDFIWLFDNLLLKLNIMYEAKCKNIKTVSYIPSGTYTLDTNRNTDIILTDSNATSKLYKAKFNIDVLPIGKYIPEEKYLVESNERKNLLFINPSLSKGVVFVIQLADYFQKYYPNVLFEIVDSRGDITELIKEVLNKEILENILITPNTKDMKSVYSRARVLLVPSFWWDSGPRVIAEAQINGIPVVGSNYGGIPEMIDDGGVLIDFPESFHQKPFNRKLSSVNEVKDIAKIINRFYEDEDFYQSYVEKAYKSYKKNHDIKKNSRNLAKVFEENL